MVDPVSTETLERQLENLKTGTHLCPIYSSPAEQRQVLVSFFRGALTHGGQCLYIADPERAAEVTRSLRELGAFAADAIDRGALILVTSREPYTRAGHFDPASMLELHAAIADRARSGGFSELRIAGEMAWVLGPDIGSERFLEFEALLNDALPTVGSSGLCQYDRRRSQPPVIRDVLRTHPVAVIDLRLHDNVYYEPVDVVRGQGDSEGARVDWMLTQLQSLTRRDTGLVDLGRLALDSAPADLMRAAQALVMAELRFEYIQIFEFLPSGHAVRLIATNGPDPAALGTVERLHPTNPLASATLRAGQPLIVSDWRHETRFELAPALREAGVTSSVSVVISSGVDERVYGMLSVFTRAGRILSDDEVLYLESIAIFLAYAMAAGRNAESFRALVENTPDPIVRFDGDLHITYVNPAVERLTGTGAESLFAKTSRDLGILEPLLPAWELGLRRAWRTGREQGSELRVRTPLGERVFDSRIVPEIGPDGEAASLLSISRDVTTQRAAEAERMELYRDLVRQQDHVGELMQRLAQNRERTLQRASAASPITFTDRERRILRLLAAGQTNRQIGAAIGLTTGTAKNHVAQLLAKLNVTDRTQAAVRAVELGIVERTAPQ